MPESKARGKADAKKGGKADAKKKRAGAQERGSKDKTRRVRGPGGRRWVAPVFIALGLLGVLWLILYYIASPYIPFLAALGGWNILIGMGLMAAAFAVATQWK